MEKKICFKCGHLKNIDDFYKHPLMADGRLNKCKDCTKNDVKSRYEIKIENPDFIEKERARGREKYLRLGYINRKNSHNENRQTSKKLKSNGYNLENSEAHHWNYNFKFDVFILNRRAHKLIHKYLQFDENSKCFLDKRNGELLDTKNKHHQFIIEIFSINNVEYIINNITQFN